MGVITGTHRSPAFQPCRAFSYCRSKFGSCGLIILHAVMIERIGERHASACRYKNEVPEGSRRSARRKHFWPGEVQVDRIDTPSSSRLSRKISRSIASSFSRGSAVPASSALSPRSQSIEAYLRCLAPGGLHPGLRQPCCRFPPPQPAVETFLKFQPSILSSRLLRSKRQQGCRSPGIPNHSPSSAAISSYLKLAIVFSQADVTDSLNFFALHHFQSEPTRTKPW